MVPISAPEVDASFAHTDDRTSTGTIPQSIKGKITPGKASSVTLKTSVQIPSGFQAVDFTTEPIYLGLSNFTTTFKLDAKGKIVKNSNTNAAQFPKLLVTMPKFDKTGKTAKGATMSLMFTVSETTGQLLSDLGFGTDGITFTKVNPKIPLPRELQFATIIAGDACKDTVPVFFVPDGNGFGAIQGRH
jgi:hypothetical protein